MKTGFPSINKVVGGSHRKYPSLTIHTQIIVLWSPFQAGWSLSSSSPTSRSLSPRSQLKAVASKFLDYLSINQTHPQVSCQQVWAHTRMVINTAATDTLCPFKSSRMEIVRSKWVERWQEKWKFPLITIYRFHLASRNRLRKSGHQLSSIFSLRKLECHVIENIKIYSNIHLGPFQVYL